ncbi:alpha/beta hydrolase (plasmid) [Deinococcus taeanensis]|uniref:alpha/beta fold hydrolase n=1 Tax=Deinococcus taeanensis TaxID=2737050 RepID=UPI001CDBEC50|nr:alpha/beta hydrolase [Deinococcus taeanensis]UBV45432.1 alpha/beta hydrolase [Deinococcus taeanensis]
MQRSEQIYSVSLQQGTVEVRDVGQGQPLLFLHGAFSDSTIWNALVQLLIPLGYRCILPTLPLGSHCIPQPPGADLTPPGLADLVADLIAALKLTPATVISNDTGTAVMQLVLTRRPEAVATAVLTSGDAYEYFLPPVLASLKALPYLPGALRLLAWIMRQPALARQPWAFGRLSRKGMTPAQAQRWSHALLHHAEVRCDTRALIRGFHRRHTLQAAAGFARVTVPVQVIWGREDRIFPVELGKRLARDLPNAEFHELEKTGTYIQVDAPDALCARIHMFLQRQGTQSKQTDAAAMALNGLALLTPRSRPAIEDAARRATGEGRT